MKPQSLALVMIVRDESRCIRRCLRSVRGLVDQIVVLDTGSTDDTVALAQAEGAEVSHFGWQDDFALARNAALALSHCDWNLILDADEELQHLPETLATLDRLRHTPANFVGRIAVNSRFADPTGRLQDAISWLSRVLPRGARFEGQVHEQVSGAWPRHDLALSVIHDGYLPAQMQHKQGRNARLLTAALAQRPGDPYLLYQLGKDHEVQDRFTDAVAAYRGAWQGLSRMPDRSPPWRHDLLLRKLYSLQRCGRTAEAIQLAEAQMPLWPDSPDFFFVLGDVLMAHVIANPRTISDILPMVREAWQQCLVIGENPGLEGAVAGRGSHLAQHNLNLLARVEADLLVSAFAELA
jgi:tetratricopeptide (TPR) repeat protein